MKITIFTSNHPRHISLISKLEKVSEKCFAIIETTSLFQGKSGDFYKKSKIMDEYFNKVRNSENKYFGSPNFISNKSKILPVNMGGLNDLDTNILGEALSSDIFLVFGSSFIKGWLIEFLIKKKAMNIHLGVSPYYRGNSCNFWACYEDNFHLNGATIHMLSSGLDSGDILFHALPNLDGCNNLFDFTMKSVYVAQKAVINCIKNDSIKDFKMVKQDKKKQIAYHIKNDFTDSVANEFLHKELKFEQLKLKITEQRKRFDFVNPFIN